MEQARYWMWAKPKHNTTLSTSHDHDHHLQVPISNNPSNNDDSWEEKAFAVDANEPLGGCIWPPRSYSCSFCRREFRSAQALGGHMNVHRRDRARLKQSSPNEHNSESTHQIPQAHHSVQNHLFSSLGFHQYPSSHHHNPVCALVYNPNNPTTPDHHHPGTTTTTTTTTNITSSSPASPSRVSAQFPCKENCGGDQQTLIPPYSSSPQSRSILATNRYYNEREKISIINVESGSRSKGSDHHDHVASSTTDHFSVSLNLVVRSCVRPPVSGGDHQDEEISCKRRRLTDNNDECPSSSIPFFIKSGSVDRVHHHLQSSEGFELGRPSSIEDLDLELRLGDRPKVK